MAKEIKETIGVCRFCYQQRIIRGEEDMTDEELTERATLSCNCEAAAMYRRRMERAEVAKENIDTLFGDESNDFYQSDEIRAFMKHGIDVINNGCMKSLIINMNKGLKCKIALTVNDEIKTSREAKSVVEFKQ